MRLVSQRGRFLALGGSLAAATLLIAGMDSNAASSTPVGSCVDGDMQPAHCDDAGAVYRVLTTAPSPAKGCPNGDYFTHAAGEGLLCLGYNAAAGDCIQDDPEDPTRVPCASEVSIPTFQVVQVVEDRASGKACKAIDGGAIAALTYAVPKQTVCIAHLPLATA